MLAGFPLFVLTVIQLSALRYQDQAIVWAQRGAIVADAAAIVWFVPPQVVAVADDAGILDFHHLSRSLRQVFGFAILLGLLAFNFALDGRPGPRCDDSRARGHREIGIGTLWKAIGSEPETSTARYALANSLLSRGREQPVDLGLCLLRFGCRYLRVPHTLLMAVNPSAEVPSPPPNGSRKSLEQRHRRLGRPQPAGANAALRRPGGQPPLRGSVDRRGRPS